MNPITVSKMHFVASAIIVIIGAVLGNAAIGFLVAIALVMLGVIYRLITPHTPNQSTVIVLDFVSGLLGALITFLIVSIWQGF